MKKSYPTGKADLMTAFMLRAQQFTAAGGTWAMINLPSWMALKSFEQLRLDLLKEQRISSLVHLGRGIFGSDFGSVAFVIDKADPDGAVGVYRRLFEQHVDVRSVETIEQLFLDLEYNRFVVRQEDLGTIPGSPLAYWLSEKMRDAFTKFDALGDEVTLTVGLRTGDNDRFLREWWEVADNRTYRECDSLDEASASRRRWFPLNKGGDYRKWYGNHEYVVNWEDDGRDVEEGLANRYPYLIPSGQSRVRGQGRRFYFSPSVSWSDVSSGEPAFRCYPRGFIFSNTGNSIFASTSELKNVIAILNSRCATEFLKVLAPHLHFDIGYVGLVPHPSSHIAQDQFSVDRLINSAREDWDSFETSWQFTSNPLTLLANGN